MNKVILSIILAFIISVVIASVQHATSRTVDILIVTLHNLGFVLGTGAATIINIFNIAAEKNEAIRQAKMPVVRFLFYFVWAGLLLMLFVHTQEILGEQDLVHWAKLASVLAILAGVSYIWFYLFPKAAKLAPKQGEKASQEFLNIQKQLKILPPIVLFFWYMDFFLNSFWLPDWEF